MRATVWGQGRVLLKAQAAITQCVCVYVCVCVCVCVCGNRPDGSEISLFYWLFLMTQLTPGLGSRHPVVSGPMLRISPADS